MNYRRFSLALMCSALTPFVAASAASVVMVQFGSFETMAEAQKRLSEVKAAHGAALGNLPVGVREVKLPPDNLTVYRTQAGPLDTRTAAQSICTKLANAGDECYVVETAVTGSAPAAMTSAAEPVKSAPAPVTITAPAPVPASPTPAETPRGAALAPLDAPVATVSAAPAPVTVSLPSANGVSPEMQAALDRAAKNPPSLSMPAPVVTTTAASQPQSSFWSRLNPFDSSDAQVTATKSPLKPDFQPAPEVTAAQASAPVLAANAVNLAPQQGNAIAFENLPPLPPPPPLTARDEEFLRKNMATTAPVLQAPEPIAQPLPPAITTPATVTPAPLPALASGSVKVEEAKRVPLTHEPPPMPRKVATTQTTTPAISLLPSSTLGQKTLWAQIGQFNDPQSALAFWENYRRNHPDFPVVRVRVTSSVQQQKHGNDRVWLRVGPFAREGFIRNLCDSMDVSDDRIRCGNVTDSGAAGVANPAAGYLNGSRYKR